MRDVWLRHAGGGERWGVASTVGSELDTRVEVWNGCPSEGGQLVLAEDDEIGLQSRVSFQTERGRIHWIRIQSEEHRAGTIEVRLGGSSGSISGTVTREDTGQPVDSARVRIVTSTGVFIDSVFTDENGNYTAEGLFSGGYLLTAGASGTGLVAEVFDNQPCLDGDVFDCDPTSGDVVAVVNGEESPNIDFALALGGSISGRVRDADTGAPLRESVTLTGPGGEFVEELGTDVAGRFQFSGLGPSEFFLVAGGDFATEYQRELYRELPCAGFCDPTTGTAVSVTPGQPTRDIDFTLQRFGTLEGQVTDEGDRPIPFVEVEVVSSDGAFFDFFFANMQGEYRASGLPTGTYFVRTRDRNGFINEIYNDIPCRFSCDITTGTPIPVEVGVTTSGIDFKLEPLGRITGVVIDAVTGETLDAGIRVYDSEGDEVAFGSPDFSTYEIFLPAGNYFAVAQAFDYLGELFEEMPCPGETPPGCDVSLGTPIAVQAGATVAGINFSLLPLGGVQGTVRDTDSGAPVPATRVSLWNLNGSLRGTAQSNFQGDFFFSALPSGEYYATAGSLSHRGGLFDGLPCAEPDLPSCDLTAGTRIPVNAATTTSGIDFNLVAKGKITGQVLDEATGLPIEGAWVSLYEANGLAAGTIQTDFDGSFEFGRDAGDYRLVAGSSNHGSVLFDGLPCFPGACDPRNGTPVLIPETGILAGIDFTLQRRGTLSGVVVEEISGDPVRFGRVRVHGQDGQYITDLDTDSQGKYGDSFGPGTYFLVGGGLSEFVPELHEDIPCPASCDPTTGTPVNVLPSTETVIDFALAPSEGIVGRVTWADSSEPVPNMAMDLWSEAGVYLTSTTTGADGFYAFDPFSGSYLISTDNGMGALDQVYDGVPCPLGSAFDGLCDPTTGTLIELGFDEFISGIDFVLEEGPIFLDGFESGNTGAWSAAVSGGP